MSITLSPDKISNFQEHGSPPFCSMILSQVPRTLPTTEQGLKYLLNE